jgi:hypothetical protein
MRIVDHAGGGDSFGGGLIYSMSQGYSSQETREFAVAASRLKHSIEGGFSRASVDEASFCVLQFFRSGVSGEREFRPSWRRGCEENRAFLKEEGNG